MIIAAIEFVSVSKYDNHKFYFHNFAKFDVIFIFKILTIYCTSLYNNLLAINLI
jgi:hypothetical protein